MCLCLYYPIKSVNERSHLLWYVHDVRVRIYTGEVYVLYIVGGKNTITGTLKNTLVTNVTIKTL